MSRMIDLIRQSAVPANIMRAASRGALSIPAAEMIEILVALAQHPVFGEQARLTLAAWDNDSAAEVAGDPASPAAVLSYMSAPENLRFDVLPRLLHNPALPEDRAAELLARLPEPQIEVALSSPRVQSSQVLLRALAANPRLTTEREQQVQRLIDSSPATDEEIVVDADVSGYLRDHAEELKEAEGQGFQLIGPTSDEQTELASASAGCTSDATEAAAAVRRLNQAPLPERESVIQKIAKLSVGQRVLLAMKGRKDERFILIRDGARVVSSAVLESPKLTESEVETFAGMKNVGESVLRGITLKRKFMKNYNVIRILTMNPRCPIDVTVPLLAHLLTADLKNLSTNKNISDTVRKLASKMYRDRLSKRQQ